MEFTIDPKLIWPLEQVTLHQAFWSECDTANGANSMLGNYVLRHENYRR